MKRGSAHSCHKGGPIHQLALVDCFIAHLLSCHLLRSLSYHLIEAYSFILKGNPSSSHLLILLPSNAYLQAIASVTFYVEAEPLKPFVNCCRFSRPRSRRSNTYQNVLSCYKRFRLKPLIMCGVQMRWRGNDGQSSRRSRASGARSTCLTWAS